MKPIVRLALFLSRATPLSRWHKLGLFDREVAIYNKLRPLVAGIDIVTSGGEEELALEEKLPGIRILYNKWGITPNSYSVLAPWLHRQALRQATVFKSNQFDGAWTAVLAGKLHRKPVIVRAGYPWTQFVKDEEGDSAKLRFMHRLQHFSLQQAASVTLTTPDMIDLLVNDHGTARSKFRCIPNYVDTDLFAPDPAATILPGSICYLGRLHPRKNLPALLDALVDQPTLSLQLIGTGAEQTNLTAQAAANGVKTQFTGSLPHGALPEKINGAEIFILPSLFEGHPKALIEAMSCGVAVIGTDVPGIRNVIQHEKTGLLCPPTTAGIRAAILRLHQNHALRAQLGRAARQFVLDHYSLDQVAKLELAALQAPKLPTA